MSYESIINIDESGVPSFENKAQYLEYCKASPGRSLIMKLSLIPLDGKAGYRAYYFGIIVVRFQRVMWEEFRYDLKQVHNYLKRQCPTTIKGYKENGEPVVWSLGDKEFTEEMFKHFIEECKDHALQFNLKFD